MIIFFFMVGLLGIVLTPLALILLVLDTRQRKDRKLEEEERMAQRLVHLIATNQVSI